jgi:hypothetical protein
MKNIWHIHWWGPFKELTHGDGKFAIEMRKDFLGEDVDLPNDEPPPAIEDSELVE